MTVTSPPTMTTTTTISTSTLTTTIPQTTTTVIPTTTATPIPPLTTTETSMSTFAPSSDYQSLNYFSIFLNVLLFSIVFCCICYQVRKVCLLRRVRNNSTSETAPLLATTTDVGTTDVVTRDVETNTDNVFTLGSTESLLVEESEISNVQDCKFTPPSDSDESLLNSVTTALQRRSAFEAAFANANDRKNLLMRTFKTNEQNTQTDLDESAL